MTCTLQYANGDGSNNGYLVFGDSTKEAELVKCGLRQKMKTAAVIQGSLSANKGATQPSVTDYQGKHEMSVTVDLASGSVTLEGGGATVKAKLNRPLKSITHVGYALNGTITDFSPIEVSVAQ